MTPIHPRTVPPSKSNPSVIITFGGPPPEVESASAMGSHDIGDACGSQRGAHCV
jgi:hypothetical protein